MSKSKLIIITIIILIFALLGVGYFYISRTNTNTEAEGTKTEENFLYNIFSFGNKTNIPNPINNLVNFITGNKDGEEGEVVVKNKLNKISSMPISGYGILEKERYVVVPDVDVNTITEENKNTPVAPNTEIVSVLKYADKTTGNIYQTFVDEIEERKFSETIIPFVHESFFTQNGVIMRYLRNNTVISTFLGELPKEVLGADTSDGNEIFGTFLPEGIRDISISPNNKKVFYLSNTKNGVVGILIGEDNSNKTQIFDSPFTEWISFWVNNDLLTLTTRPSSTVLGYSYVLDPNTKFFNKLLSGIKGLTTLMSADGETILYSNNNLSLNIFSVNRSESKNLKLRTHTEKCVWAGDNITVYCAIPKYIDNTLTYPDSWYQGEISYDDEIYKINIETGQRIKLVNPGEIYSDATIDAINLKLDKNEENLFFMNKSDSYLWGLKLK